MKIKRSLRTQRTYSWSGEWEKQITPGVQKRIDQEVIPLLRTMAGRDDSVRILARNIITNLIIEPTIGTVSAVDKLLFVLAMRCSMQQLPGYATLDNLHVKAIQKLLDKIKQYTADSSQKRPLVFLMLASPGAGKSHFIKCIAKQLQDQKIGAVTYNMAGLQSNEDMIPPLDAARNVKVEDGVPLLFLDEFDSKSENVPMLLPLLWDGEVTIGPKGLKLGKVIIVLAGSHPTLPVTMEQARSMTEAVQVEDGLSSKIVDLLSRINGGVIPIPPFLDQKKNIDRRVDKVCVVVQLLRQRFGAALEDVPISLLRFVGLTDFRYGVRSIAHLVDLIPHKKTEHLMAKDLKLPLNDTQALKQSSLAYHLLHNDQADGIVKIWNEALRNDCQITITAELTERIINRSFDHRDKFPQMMIYRQLVILGLNTNKANQIRIPKKANRPRQASKSKSIAKKS